MTTATEIKTRPILFSAEMIRAILRRQKTQTRRVIKPQPVSPEDGAYFDAYNGGPQWNWWARDNRQYLDQIIRCPYGKPGDRLWVREACRAEERSDLVDGVRYLADDSWVEIDNTREAADAWVHLNCYGNRKGSTVPPIHMPRWASRITLEVTEVRVQRLHEIGKDGRKAHDVLAEGISRQEIESMERFFHPDDSPALAFGKLWNSINGETFPWTSNPWVWAITFKMLEAAK